MTIYRLSLRWVGGFNAFYVRQRFSQGDVYRLALGPVLLKCMADSMSPEERLRCDERVQAMVHEIMK